MCCALSLISDAFQSHGPHFPGKNTEVGCHALLQGILPTQGSNPGLLHCRRIFLQSEQIRKPTDLFENGQFSLVQFSHSVMSSSLWLHGLQHTRLPYPSPSPDHWVSDAIQSSCPLSSPSPPAFGLSQHQGLFQWVSSLHQVAKVLVLQLQHQSLQWIFRTDFL